MQKKNLNNLSGKELMEYIEECSNNGDEVEMMLAYEKLLSKEGDNTDKSNNNFEKSNTKLSRSYLKILLFLLVFTIFHVSIDLHRDKPITIMRILIWSGVPLFVLILLIRNHIVFKRANKGK